jgi:hypothetical protein
VNGKTGRSVWNVVAYASVGKAIHTIATDGIMPKGQHTNLLGEVRVDVTDANSPKLRVSVDFISDGCGDPTEEYSIEEIVRHGLTGANDCSAVKVKPKPGVPCDLRDTYDPQRIMGSIAITSRAFA